MIQRNIRIKRCTGKSIGPLTTTIFEQAPKRKRIDNKQTTTIPMSAHETTKGKKKGKKIVRHEKPKAFIPLTEPVTKRDFASSNQYYANIDDLKPKVLKI